MMHRTSVAALISLTALTAQPADAQTVALEGVVVSTSRFEESSARVPFTVTTLGGEALRTAPTVSLDSALRSVPGFSLFRRSDSLTANPTAQGVSLRGLGPSGASRSLVLLDGVPLNDPFGGWVAWSKVPRDALARVEIMPGGGASAWGNAALGGVVHVVTETPVAGTGRGSVIAGDFETRGGEVSVAEKVGPGTLQVLGRSFRTDGFSTVASERRGPIDTPAGGRHHWLTGRWRQALSETINLTVTGRYYREKRANGTPYQRNETREWFGSAVVEAAASKAFGWTATLYGQDQDYAQTFSGVNATRTGETPASEQYSVPAQALGAAWAGNWQHAGDARTTAGADLRTTEGETRERFTFASGAYTRHRVAGGTQSVGGLFVLHQRPLTPALRGTLGARVDLWRDSDGHRREVEIASGSVLREDAYGDRDGSAFSPSAGLVWAATEKLRVRTAIQQAFRRPTLNELYRPFRVGNVITEANADLQTESVQSAEIGATYTFGAVALSGTAFWNELRDAVGNVTLFRGPGTFPNFGFIPAGGAGRQRLNLERARVRGLEAGAHWNVNQQLSVQGDLLLNETEVRESTAAPGLVGLRLAQVPRISASLAGTWRPTSSWAFVPRIRWIGDQFEDDENQLRLAEAVVGDLSVTWTFRSLLEVFVTVENVASARIETGRSADGLVNVGIPRFATAGVRWHW